MKATPKQIQITLVHLEAILVALKTQKDQSPKIRMSMLVQIHAIQAVIDELKGALK